jgi:formylglycine-generating enzyme required for sulfatase activity
MSTELFISYKREPASTRLAQALRAHVERHFPWVKVAMDVTELHTGASIKAYMDRLTKGDHIIFLLSPAFLESPWCMYELALTADYEDFRERVFHVRLPGVEIGSANAVAQITKAWQKRWKDLKDDIEEIARENSEHITLELLEELRIAGEIVKGTQKALLHMRGTMGMSADAQGELDWTVLQGYLRGWIKHVPPIQKLLDDMVFVQGGSFMMGAEDADAEAFDCEKPQHEVHLSDYHIGKYPVTQAQWEAVMGNNPSRFQGCLDCPVERVSWNDCQEFLKKLNALTGLRFSLPTEAQWEYAAHGGQPGKELNFKYAGSNELDKVAWYDGNSGHKTNPVGGKVANSLGLFDMSGNVWEWCRDRYDGKNYQQFKDKVAVDPLGSLDGELFVLRGGSWLGISSFSRVTYRYKLQADACKGYVGLRLQRD